MKVFVNKPTEQIEMEMTNQQLAWAIMDYVQDKIGHIDDAGCDWFTDDNLFTFIGSDKNWCVSTDPSIATLVDAANIIRQGK